ncbi:hypothetical protein BBP40_011707 [Aspergillus hancockii]|nr:hypothetical protein BBP40_011707 [Aspergillus hancockii]
MAKTVHEGFGAFTLALHQTETPNQYKWEVYSGFGTLRDLDYGPYSNPDGFGDIGLQQEC